MTTSMRDAGDQFASEVSIDISLTWEDLLP